MKKFVLFLVMMTLAIFLTGCGGGDVFLHYETDGKGNLLYETVELLSQDSSAGIQLSSLIAEIYEVFDQEQRQCVTVEFYRREAPFGGKIYIDYQKVRSLGIQLPEVELDAGEFESGLVDGIEFLSYCLLPNPDMAAQIPPGMAFLTITTSMPGREDHQFGRGLEKVLEEGVYYTVYSDGTEEILIALQFEDPNLEKAVREAIDKPEGQLYSSDVIDITSLDASERGIKSLEGIQHLQNLQELDFSHNQVSDISHLANLTKLKQLTLNNNQVSDISALSNLINLEWLRFSGNKVSDISPLANLTNLQWLYFDSNQVSDISALQSLINLQWLIFPSNQVSDISPLANLTKLQELAFHSNQISDISPLVNLSNLWGLYFDYNQVSDISVLQKLTNLKWLSFSDNQVSDISPLDNLTNLEQLYFTSNQVSDISSLQNLTNLQWLDFQSNQVSDISALVSNSGLGPGDHIDMRYNFLDLTDGSQDRQDIEALLGRGVTIHYELQSNDSSPPAAPLITSPGSDNPPGVVIDTLTPSLKWKDVSGATHYSLAISKEPYGSANIVYESENITNTSHTVPSAILKPGQRYRWNMQAGNSAGWSPISNTLYFQTQETVIAVKVHNQTKDTYHHSIQDAIDISSHGDTIIVFPGTYHENIDFKGKNITLQSNHPDDLDNVAQTIIDGTKSGSVVTFQSGETAQAVLRGFTIQNGNGTLTDDYLKLFGQNVFRGGGIIVTESSPTIRNNIITNNIAPSRGNGGGISIYRSSPDIIDNTISGNTADWFGGGIDIYEESSPTITGNTIADNSSAIGNGGGISIQDSSPTITQNTISGNTAIGGESGKTSNGGGIFVVLTSSYKTNGSFPNITGNTITGNKAGWGGGIYIAGSPTINRNTIMHNTQNGITVAGGNSSPNIFGNTIAQNIRGGIGVFWNASPDISENKITGNSNYGVLVYDSSPTISGNIITDNTTDNVGGGIMVSSDSVLLPDAARPTGWGAGSENIPKDNSQPPEPVAGPAGNTFSGNRHGNPLGYTEGAHVYFDK